MKVDKLNPIPEEEKAEWNKLVTEAKKLVLARDKNVWKLIILSGKIVSKYGQDRTGRFADEIGLDEKTIHEYRWLARAGIDEEFVKKYEGKLSYSMVRTILRHTGKVSNPNTQTFLEYALKHKITIKAMQGYMLETVQPNNQREKIAEEIKLALADKQQAEGHSDYIRFELERLAELHPELEDHILRTAIYNIDDIRELKVKAGDITEDEEDLVEQARKFIDKLRRYIRFFHENRVSLEEAVAYGHEHSNEVRFRMEELQKVINNILQVQPRSPIDVADDEVEVVELEDGIYAIPEKTQT